MRKFYDIEKIISGGQTGADMAGLMFAREIGIPTGGTAPDGYLTEKGNLPSILKDVYGLVEGGDYRKRTIQNIKDSDGTVVFADRSSRGSILTVNQCKKLNKPYIINPTPENFTDWLSKNKVRILNVAGNRESVSPGIELRTIKFLKFTIGKSDES